MAATVMLGMPSDHTKSADWNAGFRRHHISADPGQGGSPAAGYAPAMLRLNVLP
ncbi:MAG: hypothetical protein AB7K24_33335 [Gemmataceae bacterium]